MVLNEVYLSSRKISIVSAALSRLCHVADVLDDFHESVSLSFFQDGLKTADKMKQYIDKLAADLYNVSLVNLVS